MRGTDTSRFLQPAFFCGVLSKTGIFPVSSLKTGIFFGKQEVHKMGGQGSKGTLYYTLYGSPVTEVKIVKEVRRSDCL